MMDYDYIDGKGEIIFFLHGWGGDKNSFSWITNYFKNVCSFVFLSFSGFGNSPPPKKPYQITDYVLELKDLIVKLSKGKKVNLVCHSFGCRVGVKLSAMYPELVNKIFIIDGAGIKPKRKLNYYINVLRYKIAKKKVRKGKLNISTLDKFGSRDYKELSQTMKKTFVLVVNEDLKQYFKLIPQETFIFWGENDKETPLYMAKKIKKYIKNSTLYVAKNAGHFSYLDNIEEFINCLSNFIL